MTRAASTASRQPFDELDAWVIEEIDLIGRGRTRRPDAANNAEDEAGPADEDALADASFDLPAEPAKDGSVAAVTALLDEADTEFIERGVAWLRGRPDPDMILEEMWRRVAEDWAERESAADADAAADAAPEPGDFADPPAPLAAEAASDAANEASDEPGAADV